jgi:hypothetical protein
MPAVRLDASSPRDSVFLGLPALFMQQAWRQEPEPGFCPAVVRCGWNENNLLVHAVLEDVDIFNPVDTFNAPAYRFGDVFEIFLRPSGQEAYYEFHVNPRNQRYQVRIPSADAAASQLAGSDLPSDWFVNAWQIDSRVIVDSDAKQWRVVVAIPLARVAEFKIPVMGDTWRVSFSRYDYTQDKPLPVLSSTSHHPVPRFHRQQEWIELEFR